MGKAAFIAWLLVGIPAVVNSDLTSTHWFDGVVLPLFSTVFLIRMLFLFYEGSSSAASGGIGSDGGGGCDGGGCDCG